MSSVLIKFQIDYKIGNIIIYKVKITSLSRIFAVLFKLKLPNPILNPLQLGVAYLYPLKTSENL